MVVESALRVAATTILTNGTLLTDGVADRLAALAAASAYSLEVRVSLDGASAQEHDVLRGGGTFTKALDTIRRLERRGLYPIVTATTPLEPTAPGSLYDRLREALLAAGVARPRIKILRRLALGRARAATPTAPLGPADLDVLDPSRLQCTETRAVADGGIYACPILAGLPGARLARERIADPLGPTTLFHPVCRTCHETGTDVRERMSVQRIALFGGVYGNRPALEAALAAARARDAEAVYFLGDVGGFGPHPDASAKLLRDAGVTCIQGNYDAAIAAGADDCGCGYSDPRDVRFAHIAYVYTLRHSSSEHRRWLGSLAPLGRITLGDRRLLLCHGSPRQVNEFLWGTTTPTGLLERFCDGQAVDALCFTHTGLTWHRALPSGRHAVNVGVLGRPQNDGSPRVWYTLLTAAPELTVEFVPVVYDHESVAHDIERAGLPPEFAETIRTGWWTTCLETMPTKERARGRY